MMATDPMHDLKWNPSDEFYKLLAAATIVVSGLVFGVVVRHATDSRIVWAMLMAGFVIAVAPLLACVVCFVTGYCVARVQRKRRA